MRDLLFDELSLKHSKKQFLIFAIACIALVSVIYTPIYLLLSSNVLWRGSVVLFLLTELVEPLIDFFFYWGSFAFLIYIYLRFGRKQIRDFAIIYVAAVALRYLLTMFVGFLMMSFPSAETFWGEELPSALFSIGMDVLQGAVVLVLAEFCCRRPLMLAKDHGDGEAFIADCFPLTGLFDLKQPIAKVCFLSSLIPSGLKLLSRLYYDIFFWGLPTDAAEWILLATYYIADIASFVIGWLVLQYLLQLRYTFETKKRFAFES